MKITAWPNNLGFDVTHKGTSYEVFKHANGLRVFGERKCAFVYTYSVDSAIAITHAHGLLREELTGMDYRDAQALFLNHLRAATTQAAA